MSCTWRYSTSKRNPTPRRLEKACSGIRIANYCNNINTTWNVARQIYLRTFWAQQFFIFRPAYGAIFVVFSIAFEAARAMTENVRHRLKKGLWHLTRLWTYCWWKECRQRKWTEGNSSFCMQALHLEPWNMQGLTRDRFLYSGLANANVVKCKRAHFVRMLSIWLLIDAVSSCNFAASFSSSSISFRSKTLTRNDRTLPSFSFVLHNLSRIGSGSMSFSSTSLFRISSTISCGHSWCFATDSAGCGDVIRMKASFHREGLFLAYFLHVSINCVHNPGALIAATKRMVKRSMYSPSFS